MMAGPLSENSAITELSETEASSSGNAHHILAQWSAPGFGHNCEATFKLAKKAAKGQKHE